MKTLILFNNLDHQSSTVVCPHCLKKELSEIQNNDKVNYQIIDSIFEECEICGLDENHIKIYTLLKCRKCGIKKSKVIATDSYDYMEDGDHCPEYVWFHNKKEHETYCPSCYGDIVAQYVVEYFEKLEKSQGVI